MIDPANRCIGKKKNGVLQYGLLYQDSLRPIAQLKPDGSIKAVFIYAEKPNVPSAMLMDGDFYHIISDHLGSVRLVINASTNTIVQQMDCDVWGNVTNDTNPEFQPFGFAGGLYDVNTCLWPSTELRVEYLCRSKPTRAQQAPRPSSMPLAQEACPIRITRLLTLTDNGKEFTDRLFAASRGREPSGRHEFDLLCQELGIKHRLDKPRTTRTNGMVEHLDGRIADILKTHHFNAAQDLEQTLLRYVVLCTTTNCRSQCCTAKRPCRP